MKRFPFPLLSMLIFVLLILSIFYTPQYTQIFGGLLLFLCLGFAFWMIARHRWNAFQRGESARVRTFLSILLDVLKLALTFLCATLLGKLAGNWAIHYGIWAALIFGSIVCFLTAWLVSRLWEKVSTLWAS
jgi:predicted MFS family arabinose efflux permease